MVTDVIESVGAGKDYTTLDGCELAHSDPISDDKRYIAEIYDTADYNEATIVDRCINNTDATRYRLWRAFAGEEYNPAADTGVWIYFDTANVFVASEGYFRLSTVGIRMSGTGGWAVLIGHDVEQRFDSIYGLSDVTDAQARVFVADDSGSSTYWTNCIAEGDYGLGNKNSAAYGFRSDATGTDMNCYNCLCTGVRRRSGASYSDDGFKFAEGSETGDVRNCASFNEARVDYNVATGGTESHNAAQDDTASGTGALDNQVPADFLTDIPNRDFRLKSGSNGIGAGVDLSGIFTLDFLGNPHGAGPGGWDIGPYAQVAGGIDYVRAVSEEASAIETVAGVTASKRARTEVAQAVELAPSVTDSIRAQTEEASAIETIAKQKDQFRAQTEVAQAGETTTGKLDRPVTETAQAIETADQSHDAVQAKLETAQALETTPRVHGAKRAELESASAIETTASFAAYFRALTEVAQAGETVDFKLIKKVAVLETAQAIETQASKLFRPVLEVVDAIETNAQTSAYYRAVLEAAQAIEARAGKLSRPVTETAQAIETAAQFVTITYAILETAQAIETTTSVSAFSRAVAEVAQAIETASLVSGHARAVLETAQAVETVAEVKAVFRAAQEVANAIETTRISLARAVLETVQAVESTTRVSEVFRALLETAQAVEIVDYVYTPGGGGIDYIRAVLETVNAVETSSYRLVSPPVVPYDLEITVDDEALSIEVEDEDYIVVVEDPTGDVLL